jgi:hypothetical protein
MGPGRKSAAAANSASLTEVVILGPQLVPEDIVAEGLLTPDDYRALAIDHIERTCEYIFELQIVKRA